MTTIRHPTTGVKMNKLEIRRKSITDGPELETVKLLHKGGYNQYDIAAMMGVHPWEIFDIVDGKSRKPSAASLRDGKGDPDQTDLPLGPAPME